MAVRVSEIIVRVSGTESAIAKFHALANATSGGALEAARSYDRTTVAMRRAGTAMMGVGRTMMTIGLGVGAVGYEAVKSATSFQKSMEMIRTQAGASQKEVDQLSKKVLNLALSGQVAQGPKQLADSLFHLESIGLRGPAAMNALKVAMEGAAVGGSDAEATASALGAAWTATGKKAGDLKNLMGLLNATVGAGNMRMQDLVQAMGRGMVPAFQQVGLHITDAMGALDVFTDSGYNASSAAAQVSTALHFLVNPTTRAQKYLKRLGMSSTQMAQDMHQPHGLLVALKDLRGHLAKLPGGVGGTQAEEAVGAILPGGRGRILLTLLQNLGLYQQKLGQIQQHTGEFGDAVAKTHQTMSFKLHAAWSAIQASLIKLGDVLIPIVTSILPKFVGFFTGIFTWLSRVNPHFLRFVTISAMVFVLGGGMIYAMGRVLTLWAGIRDMIAALRISNILGIGTAATAAEGPVATLSATLWTLGKRLAFIAGIFAAFKGAELLAKNLKSAGAKHPHRGKAVLGGAILGGAAGGLGTGLAVGTGAAPFTAGASIPLGILIGGVAGAGAGLISSVFGAHGGLVTPHGIRRYQTGGPVYPDVVPAWLSQGEGVLNRAAMAGIGVQGLAALNSGAAGGHVVITPSPVYLYLDSRRLAQGIIRYTVGRAARGPSSLVGGALTTGVSVPVNP